MQCSPFRSSLSSVINNSLLAGCPKIILKPISVNGLTKWPQVKSLLFILTPLLLIDANIQINMLIFIFLYSKL